jgi:hypothetical protein
MRRKKKTRRFSLTPEKALDMTLKNMKFQIEFLEGVKAPKDGSKLHILSS